MDRKIPNRDDLLRGLRGQTLHVPDLQALLGQWPQYVHPELGRLRVDIHDKFQESVTTTRSSHSCLLSFGHLQSRSRKRETSQDESCRRSLICRLVVAVCVLWSLENRCLPLNLGVSPSHCVVCAASNLIQVVHVGRRRVDSLLTWYYSWQLHKKWILRNSLP